MHTFLITLFQTLHMHISELQQTIDTWIRNTEKGYFSELTNLGILMEEVGEYARWMVRQYGDQSYKKEEVPSDVKNQMADELADILWVVACLANQTGIDLTEAIQNNVAKKNHRDKDRHQKS